jgi:VWFA-related protein
MINGLNRSLRRAASCLTRLLLGLACVFLSLGNLEAQSTQTQADDVLRINTELVQTDVMVFDKRGRFVDGLRPEQFVLSLDGQPRKASLFERITSGSLLEASKLNAGGSANLGTTRTNVGTTSPGRVIFFFVDDVHLGGESLVRARQTLQHFVENKLNPEDRVAIVSTSGQIGFLQQLTDNAAVLHEAIARLSLKRNSESYAGSTRISEYMASRISDANDRQLFAYLMESVKVEYGMGLGSLRGDHKNDSAGQAARLLKSRLGQINAQSRVDTANTLAVLESLMQSAAGLTGRKLVFFLSDGFIVDPRRSEAQSILHEATRMAARAGAVVYSVDMRGSFLESAVDASNNDYVDMTSRHGGVSIGELIEPREPLNMLADETGGRTIINSTGLEDDLEQAVRETSEYYVLAWRPGTDNERAGKARIEVTVQDRPDLKVRLRRAYFVNNLVKNVPKSVPAAAAIATTPEAQLLGALGSSQPQRTLPMSLSVGFVKRAGGSLVLHASMQILREAFDFESSAVEQKRLVDVIGAAIDDRGLIYTFKQMLTVTPATAAPQTPVVWNQQFEVRPGLYQVRVAVLERSSGRTGSSMEWIEIPEARPQALTMSSLFLGERSAEPNDDLSVGSQPVRVNVDHRFARNSVLRFQTHVYNAAGKSGAPDVWINVSIFRGNQQVMAVAANRIPPGVSKDPAWLPYWSEIALNQLPRGWYTLSVSATDKVGGSMASQKTKFMVE